MKKVRFVILSFLLVWVLDLLIGSIVLPFTDVLFANVRILHPYYNHGFNAYAEGIVSYGHLSPHYHINSLGMKDRAVRNISLKNAKRRFLFIGDSFTEGVGYSYDSTFCGYLQSKVDTSKIDILNAGVASFSPKLYFLRLDYLLTHQALTVDDVYCFIDYSDVSDELFYQDFQPQMPDAANVLSYGIQKFYRNHSLIYYLYSKVQIKRFLTVNNLDRHLEFLYWLQSGNSYNEETNHQFKDFKGSWVEDRMISLPVTQKALSLAKSNIAQLHRLCDRHHVKLHIVIYPSADQTYDASAHSDHGPVDYKLTDEGKYVTIWQELAAKEGVDFVNLFPLFTSKDEGVARHIKDQFYIRGDSHWNAEGHKRIADSLYCILNR